LNKKIIVAICGASGAAYGIRLVKALIRLPVEVSLVVSTAGRLVMTKETQYGGEPMETFFKADTTGLHEKALLNVFEPDNFAAPPASGSFQHDGMVVAPCTMNTLAAIASGITHNLVCRAADVCLKEKRKLILLTRETPLSLIHLKNMQRTADAGATIMPACPGFYLKPSSIADLVDSVVARILDHLDVVHDVGGRWDGQ